MVLMAIGRYGLVRIASKSFLSGTYILKTTVKARENCADRQHSFYSCHVVH